MHFSSWDLFGVWILGFGTLPESSARPLLLDLVRTSTFAFGFGSDLGPWIFTGSWVLDVGCSMLDATIHQSINPLIQKSINPSLHRLAAPRPSEGGSMTPLLHPSSPGRRTVGPGRRWKVLVAPGSQPPLPPERRAPALRGTVFPLRSVLERPGLA